LTGTAASSNSAATRVSLLARVEKEFGIRLPVVSVFQAPTIAAMASMIEHRSQTSAAIFPIQPEGSLPPFFCVGATPLFLGLGSRLNPKRPFLGLAVPVNAVESGVRMLEELAGPMAAAIRERQPQGPYVLGGWCVAGVLAYEIARQLERAGAACNWWYCSTRRIPLSGRRGSRRPRRRWLHLMAIKTFHGEMSHIGARDRRLPGDGCAACSSTETTAHRRRQELDVPLIMMALQTGPRLCAPTDPGARADPACPWPEADGSVMVRLGETTPQIEVGEVGGNLGNAHSHIESIANEVNRRLKEDEYRNRHSAW
jgi:hypothetical protein